MPKRTVYIIIGILIALMPFLGFPSSWKDAFYVLAGLAVVALAMMRKRRQPETVIEAKEIITEVFVQNERPPME